MKHFNPWIIACVSFFLPQNPLSNVTALLNSSEYPTPLLFLCWAIVALRLVHVCLHVDPTAAALFLISLGNGGGDLMEPWTDCPPPTRRTGHSLAILISKPSHLNNLFRTLSLSLWRLIENDVTYTNHNLLI